jgi:hypothetical protein
MMERAKRFAGIEGPITEKDLPSINPLKIKETEKQLLTALNKIPPYYTMYLGRDRTIPLKKYVLSPEAPKTDK